MSEAEDAGLRKIARHLQVFRHALMDGPDAFDLDSAEFFCAKYLDTIFGGEDSGDPQNVTTESENDDE